MTKVQEQLDSKGYLSKLFMSSDSRKRFRLRAKLIAKLKELVKTEERMAELEQQLTFLKILDGEDVFQEKKEHDSFRNDSHSLNWGSRWSDASRRWGSTRERGFASSTVFDSEESEENKSEPSKDASTQRTEFSDDSDSYNFRTRRTDYSSYESSYNGGRNDDNPDDWNDEHEQNPRSSGGFNRYRRDGRGRSRGARSRFERDDQSFSNNSFEDEYYDDTSEDMDYEDERNHNKRHGRGHKRRW